MASALYSPVVPIAALPRTAHAHAGASEHGRELELDELGMAFLEHQHGALAGAERRELRPAPAGRSR